MNSATVCTLIACVFFAMGGLFSLADRPLIALAMIMIAIANFILMTQ